MNKDENIELLQLKFKKYPYLLKQLLKFPDIKEFSKPEIVYIHDLYLDYKNKFKYIKLSIKDYFSLKDFYNTLLQITNKNKLNFYGLPHFKRIEFLKSKNIDYKTYDKENYVFIFPNNFTKLSLLNLSSWCISNSQKFFNQYKLNKDDVTFCIYYNINEPEKLYGISIYKKHFVCYDIDNIKVYNIPYFVKDILGIKNKKDKTRNVFDNIAIRLLIFFSIIISMFFSIITSIFLMYMPVINVVFIILLLKIIKDNSNNIRDYIKKIFSFILPFFIIVSVVIPLIFEEKGSSLSKRPLFYIEKPFFLAMYNPFSFGKEKIPDNLLSKLYEFEDVNKGLNFIDLYSKIYNFDINTEELNKLYSKGYNDYIIKILKLDKLFIRNASFIEHYDLFNIIVTNNDYHLFKKLNNIDFFHLYSDEINLVYDNFKSLSLPLFIEIFNEGEFEYNQLISYVLLYDRKDIFDFLITNKSFLSFIKNNKNELIIKTKNLKDTFYSGKLNTVLLMDKLYFTF